MKESFSFKVTRYRDKEHRPTCALNFSKGDVCRFLRTRCMGCVDTCALETKGVDLHRRPDGGNTLIPGEWCPLWRGVER